MDIKLDAYRIFYAAAGKQSFSKAAQELFITQSAVSQSIKNLEERLKTVLFVRSKREIRLTPEGETLYEYVKNALSLIEKGESELLRFQTLEQGQLRIAAGDTLSRYLLLPFLEAFNRKYPMIRVNIVNRTSPQSLELLKAGQADLAFVNLPLTDEAVEIRPYRQVQEIFVGGSRFRALTQTPVPLRALPQYPLIFLERSSNSRMAAEKFFFSRGISLAQDIEVGLHDILLEFGRINLGILCVTREFSGDYLQTQELFEIKTDEPLPPRFVGICTLKGVSGSAAARAFLDLLQ